MQWRNHAANPVIVNPGLADFRDPKVFYHQESATWVMLLSAGFELRVYRSHNLIEWKYTSAIGLDVWGKTHVLECPDLFPLLSNQGKLYWVLVVSFFQTEPPRFAPVSYVVGNFDGYAFTPQSDAALFDFGGDFYAPQSWNGYRDAPGKQVWIAWANNWAFANHIPTYPWRGVMSLPRDLQLHERDGVNVLVQKPVSWLETYISAESDLPVNDGRREWKLDLATEKAHSLVLHAMDSELGSLQLIIDVSIIEIFVNQGEQVLTCQFFPEAPLNHCVCTLAGGLHLRKLQHVAYRTIFSPHAALLLVWMR